MTSKASNAYASKYALLFEGMATFLPIFAKRAVNFSQV
jgi:hypothetical protein